MRTLASLIRREFSRFWQRRVFVVVFLAMPLVISVVLGFVYYDGRIERLPILVVDEDHSPTSARVVDMLSENNALHVTTTRRSTLDLQELMLNHRSAAVVVIPFRFEAELLTKRIPEINCYLNMGNSLSAGVVGSAVQLSIGTLNAGVQMTVLQKKGTPIKLAERQYEAFHNNVFMKYNPAGNYLYFLWPGLIFSLFHQLLLLASAVGFSQEYADNTFRGQLLQYSRSPAILILAKVFPYLCLSMLTALGYFIISLLFRVPPPAFPGTMSISIFLLACSTCMLGTLFSIISPLPVKASQTVMTIGSPAFSLTGFAWSMQEIPLALQIIADAIPLTPFLNTLRLVWIQGASIEQVMPHICHQLLLVVIYFLLCCVLLRKKIKNAFRTQGLVPASA